MAQTELRAVNSLLTALGDSPVNELDDDNPDIAIAREVLSVNSVDMQSEGWWFNKETWDIVLDTYNKIPVQSNALYVDTPDSNWIKRGNYLYNLENHSYDFSGVDITNKTYTAITLLPYSELPDIAYNYIVNLAKIQYLMEMESQGDKVDVISKIAARQYIELKKLQMKFSRPTKLNSPIFQKMFQNVQLKNINY